MAQKDGRLTDAGRSRGGDSRQRQAGPRGCAMSPVGATMAALREAMTRGPPGLDRRGRVEPMANPPRHRLEESFPMSVRRRAPLPIALSSAFLSLALIASPATAAGPTVSVVASGLDNPRGIDVGADGRVFVAAAGHGGDAGGFGTSGRIVVIDHGSVRTYVGGLPSAISDEGEVTGPVNVALDARGNAVAVIGGGP